MSFRDAGLLLELTERVGRMEAMLAAVQPTRDLQAELRVLRLRVGSLQAQLTALRLGRPPPPDATAPLEGEIDAARQQ